MWYTWIFQKYCMCNISDQTFGRFFFALKKAQIVYTFWKIQEYQINNPPKVTAGKPLITRSQSPPYGIVEILQSFAINVWIQKKMRGKKQDVFWNAIFCDQTKNIFFFTKKCVKFRCLEDFRPKKTHIYRILSLLLIAKAETAETAMTITSVASRSFIKLPGAVKMITGWSFPWELIVGFLRGGCSRGGGNWGTLRIPREDWGTLGNVLED